MQLAFAVAGKKLLITRAAGCMGGVYIRVQRSRNFAQCSYGYLQIAMKLQQWALVLAVGCCTAVLQVAAQVMPFQARSEQVRDEKGWRIRGVRSRENKAFVIGGLFPIHTDSSDPLVSPCGDVRQERGLERMEAMLFALDSINNDSDLLPNVELGYDIRDTCNSETVGLDEAFDLFIIGTGLGAESTVNDTTDATLLTSVIVGAASSRVSVPVASLSRLFRVPQISYASSSALLTDRVRYEYFQRTIPPDDLQASAMVDILLRFGWNYVSIIYSQDPYGEPGVDEFLLESEEKGICTNLRVGISHTFTASEYDNLVKDLGKSRARVVIIFANQEIVGQLLTRINKNATLRRHFTWIASDAWARSIDLVHQFNDTAAGLFGVAPLTEHHSSFHDYFSQLTINSNARNDWFPEFYAAYASCILDVDCDKNKSVTSFSRYEQGNFIPLVIDAVYAVAHALHDFLVDNCDATDDAPYVWFRENATCLGQSQELDGTTLLEYMRAVNFTSVTGNSVSFDGFGNVQGVYEILNYQASMTDNGDLSYSFQNVGIWTSKNDERLQLMNETSFQYGVNADGSLRSAPVESECGGCEPGTYVRLVPGSCCSICEPCLGKNYSSEPLATECSRCSKRGEKETWGNNPLVGSDSCVLIPETSATYSDPWAIPSLILACLGIICITLTAIVFAIYWKTAVVKSSGREQMILLLIGIGCSFLLAFFYLAPPSVPICTIHRLGLWFCYSLMFGALVIKVQRVARIFYGIKRNLKYTPRFVSPYFQVGFTLIIVAVQMIIIIISLALVHPLVERTIRYDQDSDGSLGLPEVVITCTEEHTAVLVLSVLYESSLIAAATILGAFSFKFPENFNEAKYISFCTFALLVVWIGLVPTYFATQSQQEFQNAAISLFVILSAFAVLVFIFGPKLFVILFQPKRNTTHFSTHHTAHSPSEDLGSPGIKMHNVSYRDGEFIFCGAVCVCVCVCVCVWVGGWVLHVFECVFCEKQSNDPDVLQCPSFKLYKSVVFTIPPMLMFASIYYSVL